MTLRRDLRVIGLAGLAAGIAVAALQFSSRHVDDPWLEVSLGLVIGWSFIGTGLYAWWRRRASRFGVLMVATGFAWFAAGLAAADGPLLFTVGVIFGTLFFVVCGHLLLAFPSGRLHTRRERRLVAGLYALSLSGALPTLLLADIGSSDCGECPASPVKIADEPGIADVLNAVMNALGILGLMAVAAILVGRWSRATRPQRRALNPALWCGVALTVAIGVLLGAETLGLRVAADISNLVGLAAFASIPWAFLLGLLRSRVARAGAVSELLEALSEEIGRGDLRDLLAGALGDPSLELAYRLEDPDRTVDTEGCPLPLPGESDRQRAATDVELEGKRVGALVHDRALCDEPELLASVTTAAAFAMENGRLQAELRARVAELSASRARLIEAEVDERRRLERDLHDGAQQRLVALTLSLRVAQSRLRTDAAVAEQLLRGAQEELTLALAELRELARGIHPAVLSDRGLDAALQSLAARSPVPVELEPLDARLPEPVEAAAYFVVAEALTNVAKYAHAGHVEIRVRQDDGRTVVEVRDDGIGGADPTRGTGLRGLSDRVAALDGRLTVESSPGSGTRLRAEIPCTAVPASSSPVTT